MYAFMKLTAIAALILGLVCVSHSGCITQTESKAASEPEGHEAEASGEAEHAHEIVVTSPVRKDVVSTQPWVCQIHSCQHIEVRALEGGYLQKICVKEGQAVKKGELMFKILPTLYQARMDSEKAELQRVEIELTNAEALLQKGYVSQPEIALKKAAVNGAKAKLALAGAELGFTDVVAPFDGIVDRQRNQLGSLIAEGDILTTLSDNSLMWVYFNVPEKWYLQYKAELDKDDGKSEHLQLELKLANGQIFQQHGKIGAIEADFNNTTGNISFRADFPNPSGLLRNGQTGTILIHTTLKDVVVIPQRATYEILAKRYAFIVGEDHIVRQRDITIQSAQDDIFVIESGLDVNDKIILEGIRQVKDGDKVEYEFRAAEEVLGKLKYHAE